MVKENYSLCLRNPKSCNEKLWEVRPVRSVRSQLQRMLNGRCEEFTSSIAVVKEAAGRVLSFKITFPLQENKSDSYEQDKYRRGVIRLEIMFVVLQKTELDIMKFGDRLVRGTRHEKMRMSERDRNTQRFCCKYGKERLKI